MRLTSTEDRSYLLLSLIAVIGMSFEAHAQKTNGLQTPRLVVNIAIDQLRTDFLEAFTPLYGDGGFKHLMGRGRVFENGSYPFTPVDRASAVASIATGVTPYYNNIVGRQWLNRETLRPVYCVDDAKFPGLMTIDTASPNNMGTSTMGDELKAATDGKAIVYAIAPNRDAAVLTAGHAADGALWIDSRSGEWCSSMYYFHDMPSWILKYNSVYSPNKEILSAEWEPTNHLVGTYNYYTQNGGYKQFRHKFSGERRFAQYKASAKVNADITAMAEQCIANYAMGADMTTDLLSITYYAGPFDHQPVSQCLMEIQDTYVRLDAELAKLMGSLEKRMGRDNVLFVITSTGYSDEAAADYEKYRIPTGTFYLNRTAQLMNMYFGALWGQGKYVDTYFHNHIFLNHKLLEEKRVSIGDATQRAQEFLSMLSGVRNVYTSLQLLTSHNEHTLKIRNAFSPQRCGDIVIEVAPGWRLLNEDTHEEELVRASFVQFPIIFYGAGLAADHVTEPVTTDRIAPTVARCIRIRAPNACTSAPLF